MNKYHLTCKQKFSILNPLIFYVFFESFGGGDKGRGRGRHEEKEEEEGIGKGGRVPDELL